MSHNAQDEAGLYVVSTPIGNARDITLRALGVLRDCELIAAEDTRVTSKLLAIHGISKSLTAYNDYNAARERPRLLARLRAGARVALVSDAGTPLISDPGYKLVREAVTEGIPVYAIPGPSALLAALIVSGLPTDRFLFAGFLPSKSGERRRALMGLRDVRSTVVLFESGHRLADALSDMQHILGNRTAVIARELTKLHEDVRRGDLCTLARSISEQPPRGEITMVVGGSAEASPDWSKAEALVSRALRHMPLREAVDLVAEALNLPRRELYERALMLKARDGSA
ncbi:MAG: 16S rRNA (cytidine(1402)-2'-O)-methyltransferase [Alphaproteobacteria bacterium]|nr:16S rRNA (cytidine(1402)-2'-O)-methyltransferase [Alphaproteobacteria bacterium]MBV9063476.1 16S rRNA (cytidine(1402)-2'-O)-methyltransferase [Alphaproteobacteria bacterium]